MFPCDVFRPRIGRFRFGGFSKVGIRGCKVCRTKYYLSLRGWRFFWATARRPDLAAPYNPGITFAPATKMTADAVWNGGMGTLGILDGEAKRKRDKCGMAQRATGNVQKAAQQTRGKATLSCRRDGSPVAVIVMQGMAYGCGCSSGGICPQTVLSVIATSGKSTARRFEDRKDSRK